MAGPEFWLVAGPNGAGKTTCVQVEPISQLLPAVTFLNPDDRTLEKLRVLGYQGFADAPPDIQTRMFIESADEVFRDLEKAILQNGAVGVETVLSSDKYQPLVESVIAKQGFVGLIYVALSSASIARQRVKARVQRGGHDIPEDKIEQRWKRSLRNLSWFAQNATAFWVIDNSDSNPANPPLLLASGKFGSLEYLNEAAFPEMKAALSILSVK
jgi:predicted ABC-type ATPase